MQQNPSVAIFTLRDISKRYGSTFRPLWQADGLRKNGYYDFKLCSERLDVNPRLVHAHQDAIYHVGSTRYIADLHGVAWLTARDGIDRMPFSYRKLRARFYWLPKRRRMEEEAYRRAECLVCAGESIEAHVEHLNRTEIVRNAVALDRYAPTLCNKLRVAVVGPFVEGHENMYSMRVLLQMLRLDKVTEYFVIGPVDQTYTQELSRFPNVTVDPAADDFVSALRTCSVLLCPYPEKSGFGGTKIKVIEAAACSLAIVSTPSGIADFNRDLVLLGNTPEELVEQVQSLSDQKSRQRLGQGLRREVEERHDNMKESRKLIALYDEFLN